MMNSKTAHREGLRSEGQGLRLGAALFNGDHGHLAGEIARLEAAGLDFIHLDVYDGYFAADLGFSPHTIAALRPLTRLPFEVHLGAVEPLCFAPRLAEAGADLILFHAESVRMVYETIFAIREHNVRVGLALSLGTPLAILEPVVSDVEAVLLLSRVVGEGTRGATFNPRVLPRIGAVKKMVASAGATIDLQVAGGVNRHNAPDLILAGASSLALGAGIYRAADMTREVAALRTIVEEKGG